MWWRIARAEFDRQKGEGNRWRLKRLVDSGEVPGLLFYDAGRPVAWCSVAPREAFPVLDRSRILKRVDDRPVWSIVCFFVARSYRRHGLLPELIAAAKDYARNQGATLLEAYPVEPKKGNMPELFAFTGFASSFTKCGFREVARRSETRPVLRCELTKTPVNPQEAETPVSRGTYTKGRR
jgi:GNAT superfamily N-acetyltransferase